MIETALKLLSLDNWYGISENVEIAKGKYQLTDTFKKGINKIKRNYQWQKR
tara:strand:+ start:46 stop:198 length:153 start_codon:yes stop_codon:yes gene_type:complete